MDTLLGGRKGRAAHPHPSLSPLGVGLQFEGTVGWSRRLEALPDTSPRFFPATEDYGHYEELPGEPGEHLFPEHPLEPDSFSEGGLPGRPKPGAGVPDFLPSAQRALYLRIQQKQQEEEERARRLAESSKQDRENEEGMCPPQGQGLPSRAWAPEASVQGTSGECLGRVSCPRVAPGQGGPLPKAMKSGYCMSLRKLEAWAAQTFCVVGVGRGPDPITAGGRLVPGGDSSPHDLRLREGDCKRCSQPSSPHHLLRKPAGRNWSSAYTGHDRGQTTAQSREAVQ